MSTESKSRIIHENLDTTFVNLWALLRSLSQRGFIGRVRVEMKDYTADVFMTGSATPLVHEIDRAAGTDTLEEGALHRLVLRARETPGTISVFEGADEAGAVQSTAIPSAESDAVAANVTQVQDAPATTEAAQQTAAPALNAAESKPPTEATNREQLADPTPLAPSEDAEPRDQIEWEAVVRASGELVGAVERAVVGAGADFAPLFKAARIGLADDYAFLDPMSDGLIYANSVVTLNGEIPPNSYVAGVSEALHRVVDRVATGDRARRVRERVALELFSVARKRNDILGRSGFLSQLDRIAGTKVI